jgi:hypothetical protein
MTYIPPIGSGTTEVQVEVLPHCDIHHDRPARYDAYGHRIRTWAYLCESCAEVEAIRLGTGSGQRLVPRIGPPL